MNIIFWVFFIVISFIGGYALSVYLYGDKNPKKWKSLLFKKEDTFKNIFYSNQDKKKSSDRKK